MTNGAPFLTLGVTGHRTLSDVRRITTGVDHALRRMQEAYPGRPLCILSPLAEGADRLVVQRAICQYAAHYVVPLPLPVEDYLSDFPGEPSRREFLALLAQASEVVPLPPQPSREEAYRATGHYILNHCDALIAVWDGRSARGQGGTGEIMAGARERGLPLAWVHASNGHATADTVEAPVPDPGSVTFERLPPVPHPDEGEGTSAPDTRSAQ